MGSKDKTPKKEKKDKSSSSKGAKDEAKKKSSSSGTVASPAADIYAAMGLGPAAAPSSSPSLGNKKDKKDKDSAKKENSSSKSDRKGGKKDKSGSKADEKSKKDKSGALKEKSSDKKVKDKPDKKDKSGKKEKTDKKGGDSKSALDEQEEDEPQSEAVAEEEEDNDIISNNNGSSSEDGYDGVATPRSSYVAGATGFRVPEEEEEDEEEDLSEIVSTPTASITTTPSSWPPPPQQQKQQRQQQVGGEDPSGILGRPKGPDPFSASPRVAWCGLALKLPTQQQPTSTDSAAVLWQGTNAFERFIVLTDAPHPGTSESHKFDSDFGQLLVCLPPPCLSELTPTAFPSDGSFVAKLKTLPFERLVEGGVTRCIDVMLIDSINIFGKSIDRATGEALRGNEKIQHVLDFATCLSLFPIPVTAEDEEASPPPQPPLALGFTQGNSRALRSIKGITDMASYLCSKEDGERLLDELNRIRGEATTRYRSLVADGMKGGKSSNSRSSRAVVDVPAIRIIRDGILVGGIQGSSLEPTSQQLTPQELIHNPLHPNFGSAPPLDSIDTTSKTQELVTPHAADSSHYSTDNGASSLIGTRRPVSCISTPLRASRRNSDAPPAGLMASSSSAVGVVPSSSNTFVSNSHRRTDIIGVEVATNEEVQQPPSSYCPPPVPAAVMGYPQGNPDDPYQSEPGAWRLRDTIAISANNPQRGLVRPEDVQRQLHATNQPEYQDESHPHPPVGISVAHTQISQHPQSVRRSGDGGGASSSSYPIPANGGERVHESPYANHSRMICSSSTLPVDPHHAAETAVMARLLRQSQRRTKDLHNECEDLHMRGEEMYTKVLEHQQQVVIAERRVLAVEREKDELKAHYEGELLKVRTAFSDFDTQINAYIRTLEDSNRTEVEQLKKEVSSVREAAAKERDALRAAQEESMRARKSSATRMLSSSNGGDMAGRITNLFRGEEDVNAENSNWRKAKNLSLYDTSTNDSIPPSHSTDITFEHNEEDDYRQEGEEGGGRWISDRDLKGLVQQLERYRDVTRGPVIPDHKLRSTTSTNDANPSTIKHSATSPRNQYHHQNYSDGTIGKTRDGASTPLSINRNNGSYSSSINRSIEEGYNRHRGGDGENEQQRGGGHSRASTPSGGVRRNLVTANRATTPSSSLYNHHRTPTRTIVGGPAAVEERLRQYREDLQNSSSVKRSLADYKVRIAQEQQSKMQYEASHSLLPRQIKGAVGEAISKEEGSGVAQSRLQRFLADDAPDGNSNHISPSTKVSKKRQASRRHRSTSSTTTSSSSSHSSASSGTGSSSYSSSPRSNSHRRRTKEDDEGHFTLEEQEEEGDTGGLMDSAPNYNTSSNRRTLSSLSEEGEEDRGSKKERRRLKRQTTNLRRKLAYEKAVMRYDEHTKQEGFYADSFTSRGGIGVSTPGNHQKRRPSPSPSSGRNPTQRKLEDRREYPIQMFNLPAESYFGDVETDRSTVRRGGGVAYPSQGYHPPPPPRVMQPSIATPTRRDHTPSRVPLMDHKRHLPSAASPVRTTQSAAPYSQIFRGNNHDATPPTAATVVQVGDRRAGSPFEHRDRSIL